MTYIDIVFAIPLLWGLYRGFTKGFIIMIASLLSLFLGVYCAIRFSNFIGNYINGMLASPKDYIPLVAFCITFLAVVALVYLLGKFVEEALSFAMLEWLNKLLGAIIGIFKWAILMSITLFIFNTMKGDEGIISKETREKSYLYGPIQKLFPLLLPEIKQSSIKERIQNAGASLEYKKE
jgi:membrane protein required for colicin V production